MSRSGNDAYRENVLRALESPHIHVIRKIDWPLTIAAYIGGMSTGALIAYVLVRVFPAWI